MNFPSKKLYKLTAVILSVCLLIAVTGCYGIVENGKLSIVATTFTYYDFARNIVGDRAEVTMLLPPGADVHTFDLLPGDAVRAAGADLFIYTDSLFEPWAENIKAKMKSGAALSMLQAAHAATENEHEHEDEHEGEERHTPHIWLDPVFAIDMCKGIKDKLCAIDPQGADIYNANLTAYLEQLQQLDEDFNDMAQKIRFKTIIFSGHFPFDAFCDRYGLEGKTPYKGYSELSEPSPQDISELTAYLRDTKQTTIFYDSSESSKEADILAERTVSQAIGLIGLDKLSAVQIKSESYISLMRRNLVNLKKGLGYDSNAE